MAETDLARSDAGLARAWWRLAVALAIGTLGGGFFALLSVPLPWLLGALAATRTASLTGFTYSVPQGLRQSMIAVIGVMLGSTFTPERLSVDADWLPSLIALPVYILVGRRRHLRLSALALELRPHERVLRGDAGGLGEMIALSEQMGGDVRSVRSCTPPGSPASSSRSQPSRPCSGWTLRRLASRTGRR